jgi:hypothetical protein
MSLLRLRLEKAHHILFKKHVCPGGREVTPRVFLLTHNTPDTWKKRLWNKISLLSLSSSCGTYLASWIISKPTNQSCKTHFAQGFQTGKKALETSQRTNTLGKTRTRFKLQTNKQTAETNNNNNNQREGGVVPRNEKIPRTRRQPNCRLCWSKEPKRRWQRDK